MSPVIQVFIGKKLIAEQTSARDVTATRRLPRRDAEFSTPMLSTVPTMCRTQSYTNSVGDSTCMYSFISDREFTDKLKPFALSVRGNVKCLAWLSI